MEAKYKIGDWIKGAMHEGKVFRVSLNEITNEWLYHCNNDKKKYQITIKESNIKTK